MAEPSARPRVGQVVILKNGRRAEVISVLPGRDAIKQKSEMDVLVMTTRLQAIFGQQWLESYYEATVYQGSDMLVVTPIDVESVIDQT